MSQAEYVRLMEELRLAKHNFASACGDNDPEWITKANREVLRLKAAVDDWKSRHENG